MRCLIAYAGCPSSKLGPETGQYCPNISLVILLEAPTPFFKTTIN
jgi:hypothetical protein